MCLTIRPVTPADHAAMLAIYAPYVQNTAVSFEVEVPTLAAFADRLADIAAFYPCLVCQAGGEVAGYAYASRHRQRAAYDYDVDVSIYVAPRWQGTGAAARLYESLFALLAAQGVYNAYAATALPNPRSVRFHEKLGFAVIGTHHRTGYKLGGWHDVLWLEKALRPLDGAPVPVCPMCALPEAVVAAALAGKP